MSQSINALFLKSLLLAEITRLKFGSTASLTNPKIERLARQNFAAQVGIKQSSKPAAFITAIKAVYTDNKMQDSFNDCLQRFKLDAANF